MSKCPKCGCQCEDGAKFCDECGAPIPQEKECPKCHAHIGLNAKFCDECGFSFENVGTKQATIAMGDKNVIAGDVVAHKESYDIKGDTTIVRNEDESKKMVQCSDCGKNIPVSLSFECPSCHRIVCEECFDKDARKCKKCCGAKSSAGEEAYRTAILEALADGKIDVSDRKRLMMLQKQLGLSAARAIQIEKEVKSASSTTGESKNTATLDKVNAEKAYEFLYAKGDYKKAAELLAPIRERNPKDENILSLYLAALTKFNPVLARKVVDDLHADVLAGALALIDIDMKRKDLASVEKRLAAAFAVWPDSVLLKCRKAVYAYEMFKATEDSAPLMEATEILESIVDCKDAVEKSWQFFAKRLIDSALGESLEPITASDCLSRGLLWDIISQNEDKSNALYRIVDLSDGPAAKFYPTYYMDTESIFDWPDEFKTDLIVFRLVRPGSFIMGSKLGEKQNNPEHLVTMTHAFYMAVFELTQRQWEQVTGKRPSCFCNNQFYAKRPVECVSYEMLRGKRAGLKWPVGKNIDTDSFLGILRKKSNMGNVDLPTESQWELACRAGSVSDYYDGRNIEDDSGDISEHLRMIARFDCGEVNTNDDGFSDVDLTSGTGEVGMLAPNALGLYDMLGNVEELCLDENVKLEPYREVDPEHGLTAEPEYAGRVVRGGCWNSSDFESVAVWGRGVCQFTTGWTTGVRLAIQCYSDAEVKKWAEVGDTELATVPDLVVKKSWESCGIDMAAKYLYARCLMNGCGGLTANHGVAQALFEELSDAKYPSAQHTVASCLLEKSEKLGSLEMRKKAKLLFQDAADAGNPAALVAIKKLTKLTPECAESVAKIFAKYAVDRKKTGEFNIPDPNDEAQRERYGWFIDAIKEEFGYSDEMISRNVLALMEHEDSHAARGAMFTDDGIYTLNGAENELLWKPSVVLQWDEFVEHGCVEKDGLGYVKIYNAPETYISVWNQFLTKIDDAITMFKEIKECVTKHMDFFEFSGAGNKSSKGIGTSAEDENGKPDDGPAYDASIESDDEPMADSSMSKGEETDESEEDADNEDVNNADRDGGNNENNEEDDAPVEVESLCKRLLDIKNEGIHKDQITAKMVAIIKAAADKGDGLAAYVMGQLCFWGLELDGESIVEEDADKALEYYLMGAKAGNSFAQCEYGVQLCIGVDGSTDHEDADEESGFPWIEKSGENGNIDGLYRMTCAYIYGDYGQEVDFEKALVCFKKIIDFRDAADWPDEIIERAKGYLKFMSRIISGDVSAMRSLGEWLKLREGDWEHPYGESFGGVDSESAFWLNMSQKDKDEEKSEELPTFEDSEPLQKNGGLPQESNSLSDRKRIVFLLLGVFLGFVGFHFKYARRELPFHLTWLSLATFIVCMVMKHEAIGGLFSLVWLVLWLGGAIFVKRDGEKKMMKWF